MSTVIAVDPGIRNCGVAVLRAEGSFLTVQKIGLGPGSAKQCPMNTNLRAYTSLVRKFRRDIEDLGWSPQRCVLVVEQQPMVNALSNSVATIWSAVFWDCPQLKRHPTHKW